MTETLPSVFIGSSSEGLDVAREIELQLQRDAITTIWKDGVFGLGSGTLESLMNALDQFDFAVIVLSPDDLTDSRGRSFASPRDNVIFELGLFMGRLGRSRVFIVHEHDANLKLPSDLAGITVSSYRRRNNLAAALSPASTPIIKAIRALSFSEHRTQQQIRRLEDRQQSLESQVQLLISQVTLKGIVSKFELDKVTWLGTRRPFSRVLSSADVRRTPSPRCHSIRRPDRRARPGEHPQQLCETGRDRIRLEGIHQDHQGRS